jgi:glycosyltransferase involved in cell wall biosynthesis
MGSPTPYANIKRGEWITVEKAQVLYLSDARINAFGLWSILLRTPHDVLYLNSALSAGFSIIPMLLRRLRLVPRRPVIVASRGQFSTGALALKSLKKRSFIAIAGLFRLYQQPLVTWQASTSQEESEIRLALQHGGFVPRTSVALNLLQHSFSRSGRIGDVSCVNEPPDADSTHKVCGQLNAVFLSRISPKKNLLGVLKALMTVRGAVRLTVYGPLEDTTYWQSCLDVIKELPKGTDVHYGGVVQNKLVGPTLSQFQVFVFPTFGENFGHVIAEALMAGCPVLTTDATPWEEIQTCGAGTIVRGTDTADVAAAIQRHIDMDGAAQLRMSSAAKALGGRRAADPEAIEQNRALFVNAACDARG